MGLAHECRSAPQSSHLEAVRCVRCISDIHVDCEENMAWLEALPEFSEDVLIVAGDISDDMALARSALRTLKSKFSEVLCVPGNHDLWLQPTADPVFGDCMEKLDAFLAMCNDEGVHTGPLRVDGRGGSCCVVPLLSWHHQSFDTEPDITEWEGIPPVEKCMCDFRRCRWRSPLDHMNESVAQAVDALNERGCHLPDGAGSTDLPIISFSHFVPRIELTPEKRFLFIPTLNKAVGSRFLEDRIRSLGSTLHVFGHTHFGWDVCVDGIRYIQAALGYPSEWRERAASMEIGDLRKEPLVLWSSTAGFVPPLPARWSTYYSKNKREPEINNKLAPYVAPLYTRLPRGEICDWPMGPPKQFSR